MVLPDFVDLNKIAAGVFWWHQQIISRLQIVSSHHFVGSTNMVCTISVASPPWCPGLKFLNPSPFFGGRRAEVPQKFLHLEIFWGFRTRTAAAGGGQYLTGGGVIGAAAGGGRRGRG